MVDFTNKEKKDKDEEEENLYTKFIKSATKNNNFVQLASLFDKLDDTLLEKHKNKIDKINNQLKTNTVEPGAKFDRTIGGGIADVGQETLQLTNMIADKTNLYDYDEDLHDKQQEVMGKILTNLFGASSVEKVNRGGKEIVKVKEPEYRGGTLVRDITSIIGSVVAGTKGVGKVSQMAMKTDVGKEIAENIAKSKTKTVLAKTAKTATGATIGEQISINPYEARLANLLGEFIEDDDGTLNDIIDYLEADDLKTEAEARMGLFVEGLGFTVGLPAAFFGGKAMHQAFKNKDAAMKTMKFLRTNVQEGKLDITAFKDVVNAARTKFKDITETQRAPLQNKDKKFKTSPDEDVEKLWQFSPNKIKRAVSRLGIKSLGVGLQEIVRSRGFMTPRMFDAFNKRGAAKNAWVDGAENVASRLDSKISTLSSKYAKYKDPAKLEQNLNELLQHPSFADNYKTLVQISREGTRGKSIQQRIKGQTDSTPTAEYPYTFANKEAETNFIKFFEGVPKDMIDDLGEMRLLIDDFSELFLQLPNNQISKELKETITNNLGTWLHRSYEVFESPALAQRRANQFGTYVKNLNSGSKDYLGRVDYLKEFDAGLSYLTKQLSQTKKFAGADELIIQKEAATQIQSMFDDIANKSGASDYFGRMDSFFGANKNIFKRRGDIDEPLRDLLGEIKSPSVNILKSVSQVASYIEDVRFADEAYALLKGRTALKTVPKTGTRLKGHIFSRKFTDEVTGIKYHTKLQGTQYGKLNGKFVTEEMGMMFGQREGLIGTIDNADWYKNFLAFKGYAQASKTVFNHITHLRNTIGGALFTLANGNNPFSKDSGKALSAIYNRRFKKAGKEEALQYYNKLVGLDVVNSGVKYGEVESILKDAADSGAQRFTSKFLDNLDSTKWLKNKALKYGENIQNAYIAEDDLFKIISFESELDTLMKAARGSTYKVSGKRTPVSFDKYVEFNPKYLEDLEREAAQIVRNTIPTYSLVPTGIKQLRKLPIGNFFSFPAEMVRTTINIAKQGSKELMLSGNNTIRLRGARRLGGLSIFGAAGSEGLSSFTKMWHGVSDEEEEALRLINPKDYSKNSKFVFYRDKEGGLYKNDFSFIDPYDVLKRPIQAAIYEIANGKYTEEDMDKVLLDASLEGINEFMKPFVSEALLTSALANIVRGKTSEGYPIDGWRDANVGEKTSLGLYEIYKAFAPGALREIPKTTKAFMGDDYDKAFGGSLANLLENITTGKTGEREYTVAGQIIANTTGLRFEKVNIELDLKQKAKKYLREFDDASRQLGNSFNTRKDGNDVLNGIGKANKQHYYAFKNLKLAFDAADKLGMSQQTRDKILKDVRISTKTRKSLSLNTYNPIVPSDTQYERFKNENNKDAMTLRELKYYTSKYNRLYMALPIINIAIAGEEDTDDSPLERMVSRKQIDLIRKPSVEKMKERARNSKGGFIEGPDVVSDTKENPADRVNPYTGKPYQEQIERLARGAKK
tara:strand:+ start:969 stop:5411 length:4443 start_codon:yes stop_codon:yes gene_type:complete